MSLPCSKMNKSSVLLPAMTGGCSSSAHPAPTLSLTTSGILFHERQIILPCGSWMMRRAQARLHGCAREAAELGLASSMVKRPMAPQTRWTSPTQWRAWWGTGCGVHARRHVPWWGPSDGRRVWGASWLRGSQIQVLLSKNGPPSVILPPPS